MPRYMISGEVVALAPRAAFSPDILPRGDFRRVTFEDDARASKILADKRAISRRRNFYYLGAAVASAINTPALRARRRA